MFTSSYHITTLVTDSQTKNHQPSDLQRNRLGDNGRMSKNRMKNRIRELREDKDWSLEDLAQRVGISAQHLNRLETGHSNARLNETNIQQLCKVFNVSVSELFGEKMVKKEDSISQADLALAYILKNVIALLMTKSYILPEESNRFFTHASNLYQGHNLPNALMIVRELRNAPIAEASAGESELIHTLLALAPVGSA